MPTLTLELTAAESRALRAKARAEKQTLTAFARSRLIDKSAQPARRKLIIKKHPVSGLPYNATPGPMVSQAEIDAALAEFP